MDDLTLTIVRVDATSITLRGPEKAIREVHRVCASGRRDVGLVLSHTADDEAAELLRRLRELSRAAATACLALGSVETLDPKVLDEFRVEFRADIRDAQAFVKGHRLAALRSSA